MTVKFSQERKVRSLAKKTLGSTRVGRAIRFPGVPGLVLAQLAVEMVSRAYLALFGVEAGLTSCSTLTAGGEDNV